jgi:cell wall-associated NlpC family hydrolase
VALAGVLFAPHYARAVTCHCVASSTMMRARPHEEAPAVSQIVHGEGFALLEQAGGWAWGYSEADHYVGYVPAAALGSVATATHRVTASTALVFTRPDFKSPQSGSYPLGARIAGTIADDYLRVEDGYIHLRHLSAIDAITDPVEAGLAMLGLPYLWGGRGAGGLDCSGLVQRALEFGGIAAPRDSDQQRDMLGTPLADDVSLMRGDLVFFPGHVGLMVDGERLLHANAFWMSTVVEPLADVVGRLAPAHAPPITARRRLNA